MKRKMAFILALALVVSSGFMAFATESGRAAQTQEESGQTSTEETPETDSEEGNEAETGRDSVETNPLQSPDVPPVPDGTEDSEGASESGTDTGDSSQEATPTPDVSENPEVPSGTPGAADAQGTPLPGNTQDPSTAAQSPQPGGTQSPQPGSTQSPPPDGTSMPVEGDGSGSQGVPGETGQIDVVIAAALDMKCATTFNVNIAAGDFKRTGNITLPANCEGEEGFSFEGLPDGTYTLTVTAPRFASFTQDIEVKGKAYKVGLATGFQEGIEYTESSVHPGILMIGDVNGDGKIDEADRKKLVDSIDDPDVDGGPTDLNGDGYTNLSDLEYFVLSYNDTRHTQATAILEYVPRAVVSVVGKTGTEVKEGSLENLLKDNESVKLAPANGQPISEQNPVELEFDFTGDKDVVNTNGIVIEATKDNPIGEAEISVVYTENGKEITITKPFSSDDLTLVEESNVEVKKDGNGNILLYLGNQVAVKKVTITIRGMRSSNNLAEISKVEFVNGMDKRIPEPKMDIPQKLAATPGSKQIQLKWDPCINVTGYEVEVREAENKDKVEKIKVAGNAFTVMSFGQKELTNYKKYEARVQSVNGTWRSGFGEWVEAIPQPSGKPDAPDMVKASGQYKRISVSWKKMEDTEYYRLFYKKETDSAYQEVGSKITTNSYAIEGLEDQTAYQIYVIGGNSLGESKPSLVVKATTTDLNPASMLKYKLINTGEPGQKGAHIISATMHRTMKDSPLDVEAGTAWGTVDHDPFSYYYVGSWDDGGYNPMNSSHGLKYEFDQAYMMDRFAFHGLTSRDESYSYVKVRYWDENGQEKNVSGAYLQRMTDEDNHLYFMVRLPQAVKAKAIQFGIANYLAYGDITVSEVYFYHYDSIFDDIMALYADDLHTELKAGVTQETIDALRIRINTKDEVSGEYHPDKAVLERELQNAEAILKAENLSASIQIHNTITTNDVSRGFGGLNAWQPLGITAAAGEKIVVYVGHNTKKTGENTNLQLVATQYNSEANTVSKVVGTLKIGANEITVPKLWEQDYESGGALYVQYTGNNANDRYAVRVSGGVQVPILDLYGVTNHEERLKKTTAYVEQLETYVANLEDNHKEYHEGSENKEVKYAYDVQTCVLGASDIMLDTMMFSLPASQILAGSGSGDANARAQKILTSMDAMEEMMYLFYQHKGLNKNAEAAVDRIPAGHQNIRYQRMFAKAFMYASGNHIGIGWDSASGMVSSPKVVADANGKYESGSYFGWGIAHEIGHCINQGAYAVAEITNNYFAVLAQAKDTNDSVRFQYSDVYKKVTSGAKGRASNVFTQLGMYWQLHLAYDNGYNFKTYENHKEQLENLFFARVDTYARTPSKAPKPKGIALTLSTEEQNLMRLSCAAAQKNLLEFFERWGMTPDDTTRKYAEQFPAEKRAIYYINDEARKYRLTSGAGKSVLGTNESSDDRLRAVSETVTATLKGTNQVEITLSCQNISEADVLGYEIVRCMYEGGKVTEEPVGFVLGSTGTFTDTIATINNRTVFYKVTLIDKYLYRSAVKELEPLKIEHDGSLDKSSWTVSTSGLAAEGDDVQAGNSNSLIYCPEEPVTYEKEKLIDNKTETVYTAKVNGTPEITLNFNKTLTVAGFKMTGSSSEVEKVEVRCNGMWREDVKLNAAANGEAGRTFYFSNEENKYVATYEADAVKLTLKAANGSSVSIAELDVLGVTGDNVDFRKTEDGSSAPVIGILKEAYQYGEDVIPKGSIVFAGSYKGNAAYNTVLLFDQKGENVGKVSEVDGVVQVDANSIILADVPETGNIADVTNGTWIYWLDPGTNLEGVTKVRAELYRVNKAETNEGQRLVSDSLFVDVPATLPEVTLDKNTGLQ